MVHLKTFLFLLSAARRPFRIAFRTDGDEVSNLVGAAATADIDEQFIAPAGIIGFSLDYFQLSC